MPPRLLLPLAVAMFAAGLAGCSSDRTSEPFAKLADEFIYTSLSYSPPTATQAGYRRHGAIELDSILEDYSPASLERQRRWFRIFVSGFKRAPILKG